MRLTRMMVAAWEIFRGAPRPGPGALVAADRLGDRALVRGSPIRARTRAYESGVDSRVGVPVVARRSGNWPEGTGPY